METRQNILVLMPDDHAQWALGCYGHREVRTPTLDYLAATGVRFANAFTPTPVCSTARASFWTGRLASQHGLHDYLKDDDAVAQRDWLAGEVNLAQVLAAAGYQTALVGKWHCGRNAVPQPGFDEWFAVRHEITEHTGPYTYAHNGRLVEHTGYQPDVLTEQAVRWLRQLDRSRPFFLFISHMATHSPWLGHPEWLVAPYQNCRFDDIPADMTYPFGRLTGESKRREVRERPREALAQYYAAVGALDTSTARLLNELNALSLREQTLVVYSGDHGLNCGHHGLWGKGNATRPLNMLEESIRVPLILHQPGRLFGGQVRPEFVDHCDLYQTLLESAGLPAPAGVAYPGHSFWPMVESARPVPGWKTAQVGEYGNLRMLRTHQYKLVRRYPDGPNELFDLLADPRETTNRFAAPERQAAVAELTEALEEYFARFEDRDRSGLRVRDLPQHNPVEAWRGEPE